MGTLDVTKESAVDKSEWTAPRRASPPTVSQLADGELLSREEDEGANPLRIRQPETQFEHKEQRT
jgi:hypothetical protein